MEWSLPRAWPKMYGFELLRFSPAPGFDHLNSGVIKLFIIATAKL